MPKTVRHEAVRVHRADRRGAVRGTPLAHANEDPAANPPNCSAADLEGVRAGVQAATSAYLFAHPDVNDFFNSLEGLTREPVDAKVQAYMTAHPQTQADLTGIRQPLVDIKNRCGSQRAATRDGPPTPHRPLRRDSATLPSCNGRWRQRRSKAGSHCCGLPLQ